MENQSVQLLDLALSRVRDHALILVDVDGTIVGWRWGAEQIFGYTPEEAIGQQLEMIFTHEDRARGLHRFELDAAARDSHSEDDRWHVRKDGSLIWVSGTVTALHDASGLRGFVKIARERTDLRMASEARANQLVAVEGALERTRNFMETLGHELRNPLAPIRNATAILGRVSKEERVLRAAQMIANQVDSLERLASDLMDVSRLEHRKLELRLAELDLRDLVKEEAAGHKATATAKGLELEVIVPMGAVTITADADRLRQAIANLLTNAIKYTPAGGSVWVKVTAEAEDAVVRVQDTGIGIAPEILPRIFELFTQELRAKDLVPGGLGVGLGVVKQIAELHGGVVQARSPGAGKGSEFTLRLPCLGEKMGPA